MEFARGHRKTVDWYKEALLTYDMYDFCVQQIKTHQAK